jgi:hypothetical protein
MPSTTLANKGGATATAQTQAQQATTPPTKPAPTVLRAVQTKQTPLAQAARHATPALLAGLFALRFGALVADPVATMASSLPLAAALQAGYAVLCLPVAGSQAAAAGGGGGSGGGGGAKTGRKVKPVLRPGEGGGLRRRVGGGAGDGGAVVVSFFFLPSLSSFLRLSHSLWEWSTGILG